MSHRYEPPEPTVEEIAAFIKVERYERWKRHLAHIERGEYRICWGNDAPPVIRTAAGEEILHEEMAEQFGYIATRHQDGSSTWTRGAS